ncbi:hypothetical protein EKD04_004765 [Chloroflexales bacterium ZM16-3]|nr:hypothetical protein [Chloroflexales bacterium ZM16-3]
MQAPRTITFRIDDPGFYWDFNDIEHDSAGQMFRWMGQTGHLNVPRITTAPQIVTVVLENVRPDHAPVALQISQDISTTLTIPPGRRVYTLLQPASPAPTSDGLTLTASTFHPSGDRRELSLVIRSAMLNPLGDALPWWSITAVGLLTQVLLLALIFRMYRAPTPLLVLAVIAIPLQVGLHLNAGYDGGTARFVWIWVALIFTGYIIQALGFREPRLVITLRRWQRSDYMLAAGLALSGAVLRIALIPYQIPLLNGDDYLTASYAVGILKGQQSLYYGHHTGTIASYLLAPIFAVGGISTVTMLLLPILLTAMLTVALYGIGCDFAGRWGGVASALWIALPPATPLWWTMKPQPGYLEAITFAALALWLTLRLFYGSYSPRHMLWLMVASVLCAVLALWAGIVTISALLVCGMIALIRWRRLVQLPAIGYALSLMIGLLLAIPTGIYIVTRPGDNPLWWTFGRHIRGLPPTEGFVGLITQLLPLVLGVRPPSMLVHGSSAIGYALWWVAGVTFFYVLVRAIWISMPALISLVFVLNITAMFCFSSFNTLLYDARYVLPLYVAYPLLIALFVGAISRMHAIWATLFLTLLTMVNILGGVAVFYNSINPSLQREETLVSRALLDNGITYVYTSYWIGQPLMIESGGLVTASAMIGPTRTFYDERVEHAVLAADQSQVAFVIRRNSVIDVPFSRYLVEHGTTCQRDQVGSMLIYSRCLPFPNLNDMQQSLPDGSG